MMPMVPTTTSSSIREKPFWGLLDRIVITPKLLDRKSRFVIEKTGSELATPAPFG
jgi:hypothetical protein